MSIAQVVWKPMKPAAPVTRVGCFVVAGLGLVACVDIGLGRRVTGYGVRVTGYGVFLGFGV